MTLRVSAVGSEHISYEWKKDGETINDSNKDYVGTNGPVLTIPSAGYKHQGDYRCEVKDDHDKILESISTKLNISEYTIIIALKFNRLDIKPFHHHTHT